MSATSLQHRDRDSIYNDVLQSTLKEGNKHILFRNFLLGNDWNKSHMIFLYQALSLLSDFSCDVETYFNYKLKDFLDISSDTTISTDAIILDNEASSLVITKTDSVSMVEWFLKSVEPICEITQDNISNTIYVNDNDLLPYEGTLEEKIVEYINSLGYIKEDINSEIWVDYIGDSDKP